MIRLLFILALVGAVLVIMPRAKPVAAHHSSTAHAHSGYLYGLWATEEEPTPTATGTAIPLKPGFVSFPFLLAYTPAYQGWNSALLSTTGFNVFVNNTSTANVSINSGVDEAFCGIGKHGCAPLTDRNTPLGLIYMFDPAFADADHRKSDLMHELGHVLYHAGEHYPPFPDYNCSSIMGHCNNPRLTSVQAHDVSDFQAAYRIIDAPDAVYGQLVSSNTLRHFFEGGYFSDSQGNGFTIHAEKQYWLDRAFGSVTAAYGTYLVVPRRIDNVDDTVPNSFDIADLPTYDQWCFKLRGEAGAIQNPALTYHWGPLSRAYCVSRSGANSGVSTLSNRNDYVLFQIWNYSGAQIGGVALMLPNTTVAQCSTGAIPNNSSWFCFWWGAGVPSGHLDVWYDYFKQDEIDYDSR